jgi:hypothetical protein
MAEHPIQTLLVSMVEVETPPLVGLDFLVVETSLPQGFITSDAPCVWFDPKGYKRPPFYSQPALIYPSIEITLPISPRQMVVLNRRGLNGYSTVSWQRGLDDLNRRIRFCAHEYFIANSGAKKDIWFNPGIEPEDSWRKLHGKHQEE